MVKAKASTKRKIQYNILPSLSVTFLFRLMPEACVFFVVSVQTGEGIEILPKHILLEAILLNWHIALPHIAGVLCCV